MNPTFTFTAELWLFSGDKASWVMVTVPEDEADEIGDIVPERRGFGSVRVEVAIEDVVWRTSVFPSTELKSYVLPIKKDVRRKAGIDVGDSAEFELTILLD